MTEKPHSSASDEDWEPPNRCVRAFIEQAFDVNDLRNFCQDYYPEIHRRLNDGEGFDAIARRLIAYSDQRGAMPALWANFRRVRPNSSVDLFYARWQKAASKVTGHLDGYTLQHRQIVTQTASEPNASNLPTNLSGRQQGEFHAALLNAFNGDTLRQMVRVELGETLDHVAGGSNFSALTFELIAWAIRTGRLPDLLEGTCRAVPDNPKLNTFLRSLK